jgi:hypothetical protein
VAVALRRSVAVVHACALVVAGACPSANRPVAAFARTGWSVKVFGAGS